MGLGERGHGGQRRLGTRLRSTRAKVLTAIGAIVTAVVTGVAVNVISGRIDTPAPSSSPPSPPSPTSTRVDVVRGGVNPAGPKGWTTSPVTSRNDYVSVTAKMAPSESCSGGRGWVFPGARPADIPALPPTSEPDPWAAGNGGVPLSMNPLKITVLAQNHRTVVITDFGVRIVRRTHASGGTIPVLTGGCGALAPSYFKADAGRPDPVAKPVNGMDYATGKMIPAVPLPHTVSDSSPEQWILEVFAAGYDCEFVPYFDWVSAGNSGRFEIPLNGGPWRVRTGSGAVYADRDAAGRWSQ